MKMNLPVSRQAGRLNGSLCRGRVSGSVAAMLAIVAFLSVTVALYSNAGLNPKKTPDSIALTGRVVDELGEPIAKGSVLINGQPTVDIEDGRFNTVAPKSTVLQLQFQSPDHYPMIHSFSPQELEKNNGLIPDVTLVTRKAGRTFLAFGGDVMAGRRYYKPLQGDKPLLTSQNEITKTRQLLTHVKPYLEIADIASVNLEIVIAEKKPAVETPKSVTFYSRPPLLEALKWAGVDYVSLGNNHIYDFGEEGVALTQKHLNTYGIPFSGGGENERQALDAYRTTHQGNTYSFLGYVGWKGKFTPNQVAEAQKGGAAYGSMKNIRSTVTRESNAGNVTIVQYHGGREYHYLPTSEQVDRMRLAIDSGSDLVVSHHPHVLQGFELFKDKLIAYSLGNFLFDQYFQETHRSALLYVWMDGEKFVRAEIVPLYVKHYQTTPAVGAVRQHVLRRAKHQSYLNGVVLSQSGGHGVVVPGANTDDEKEKIKIIDAQVKNLSLTTGKWSGKLSLPWRGELLAVTSDDENAQCRTGRDLLVTGDFESDRGFVRNAGTWRFSPGSGIVAGTAGNHKMKLAEGNAEAVTRGFHRLVEAEPGAVHSLVGKIRSGTSQALEVCLEYAPRSRPFSKSLQAAERECFGTISSGKDTWTHFEVMFPVVDKEKIKGYRLRLQAVTTLSSPVYLDDLSWVAWNSPVACKDVKVSVENIDALSVSAGQSVQVHTGKVRFTN